MVTRLGALIALLHLGSCVGLDPSLEYLCERDGGCLQSGFTCWSDGVCRGAQQPADASVDAGHDAAVVDSGVDAAVVDAGVDAAVVDAGVDAAVVDSGVDAGGDAGVDAGVRDAAIPDSGVDGGCGAGTPRCQPTACGRTVDACGAPVTCPDCLGALMCTAGLCSPVPGCTADGWCHDGPDVADDYGCFASSPTAQNQLLSVAGPSTGSGTLRSFRRERDGGWGLFSMPLADAGGFTSCILPIGNLSIGYLGTDIGRASCRESG